VARAPEGVEHRQEFVGADSTSRAASQRFWVRLGQRLGRWLDTALIWRDLRS